MANKHTWTFPTVEVADVGGLKEVIRSVRYVVSSTDGVNTTLASGDLALPEPDPEAFVPYEKLTEDWIKSLGLISMPMVEKMQDAKLVTLAVPKPVIKPAPWVKG